MKGAFITRAVDLLALRRNTALLLICLVWAGTGEQLWLKFAPMYLKMLGAGVAIIGCFDALQTFLGAIYAYPGGWVTDRFGQRRSLFLFNALSVAGYLLVYFWHHWIALLAGSLLFLAWSALSLPATFSVVATSLAANRHTMGIGLQSLVRRIPMMIGPLTGGWLVDHFGWDQGVRFALLGCVGFGVVTAFFQWFMVEPEASMENATSNPRNASFLKIVRAFSPALRELLVSDILIRFCERIPFAFAIFWAMDHGGLNAQQFGLLVAAEMAVAMACYIPVAHWADRYGRRPFVLITFGFFTLYPLLLLFAHDFCWLLVAYVVRGLKEFGEPARKALILAEASSKNRARTYGSYYLIRDCAVTTGSFIGAGLWHISPQANFLGAAFCGAMGTLWFWIFVFRKG